MPTPQGIQTVTLHGRFVEPDLFGTPLVGSVVFTPNVPMVTFPNENTLMSGTETAALDANGEFTIDLPCTDTPDQNPDGWTYTVTERLIGVRGRTYQIALPFTLAVVELADITPTDATPGFLPVTGPMGPPGLVTSVNGISLPNIVLTADDIGAVDLVDVNQPDGVVGINSAGKVGVGVAAGAPRFSIQSSADEVSLLVKSTDLARVQPVLRLGSQEAANLLLGAGVNGDVNLRLQVKGSGELGWGDGLAVADTFLSRTSAGVLTATGQVASTQPAPTAVSHLTRKDYVDGLDGANVKTSGSQTIAGTKTFSGVVNFDSTVDFDGAVDLSSGAVFHTVAPQFQGATTSTVAVRVKLPADAQNRLQINADGTMAWGTGAAAQDVSLYRSAVGVLNSTGQIISDVAAPTAAGHLTRKDYVDAGDNAAVKLTGNQTISGQKTLTDELITSNLVRSSRATGPDSAIETRVTGEGFARWFVRANGENWWGSGAAVQDVKLYRGGANLLKTDSNFEAANFMAGTPYAAVWGGTGVSIGNGSVTGRYHLLGKLCFTTVELIIGTTSNTGTGTWFFRMPFTAASPAGSSANWVWTGSARGHASNWYTGVCSVIKGTDEARVFSHEESPATEWKNDSPIVWPLNSSSYVHLSIVFEIA